MKKQKDKNNPYFPIFALFSLLSFIFIISPLLLYLPIFKSIVSAILGSLKHYKEAYLNIIGTIIGTGVAVSSALWIQRKDAISKEVEASIKENEELKLSAEIVYNWIKREINMLWGTWIWAKYEPYSSSKNENDLFFEPFCVSDNRVYDSFLRINKNISANGNITFYQLYYFAEKINEYIENYNRMNVDIASIESDSFPFANNTKIISSREKNSTSEKYKEILKYNINNKSIFLFFDNDVEVVGWETFMVKKSRLSNQYYELVTDLARLYKNAADANEFAARKKIEKFIDGTEQVPEGYAEKIEQILVVKREINHLEEDYYGSRTRYFSLIEKPMVNNEIKTLLKELSEEFGLVNEYA